MNTLIRAFVITSILVTFAALPAWAGSIDPTTDLTQFEAGTTAVAKDVNANFNIVATEVTDNDSRIAILEAAVSSLQSQVSSLQSQVSSLQSNLSAVQANSVLGLHDYLTLDTSGTYPCALFTGLNVQVVNGGASTVNGLGNLIIGYNKDEDPPLERSGSHNLIIGPYHTYSNFGGLVAGFKNSIIGTNCSVTGGALNIADGANTSVTGGSRNVAENQNSTVSGGIENIASNNGASVSGGYQNVAAGATSIVLGGKGWYTDISNGIAPPPTW